MAHSAIPTSGVIGRDSDKKVIVDLLMQQTVDNQSGNSQSIVSVIPIVGIGGLGKTTLAKSVYDESKDVGHFELRMWVHVSVDFDSHRLMAKILSSALDKKISDDELSVVQLQDKVAHKSNITQKAFPFEQSQMLSLPEGMDRLTALRDLKIKDCTELQRRCKRDTGEDWPKIAHIPNLSIF
ncbi:hypothetical protein M0R45_030274 [Rubus argutus]|uniref:NB-ARC domain-containing protein n=1 Tax=Rubus argutus TaxID=59490 RepID=A0AAW1WDP7_RUBAR